MRFQLSLALVQALAATQAIAVAIPSTSQFA